MIYRLSMEFTVDKKQKIDYNIGSVLQGIMMTFLDRDYGEVLHRQSLMPYSQHFETKEGKYYWIINALTEEAKENIICKILDSDKRSLDLTYRKSKLNIERLIFEEVNLFKDRGEKDIVLNFKTPTSFKRTSGGYEIFPNVRHIFNSLINKYEMFEMNNLDDILFSKINKKEDFLEDIIEKIDIVGYNLKTERFGIKGNYIPGFMGKVNIKVKGSAEFKNNISKLLQFGEYSGVGLKCTMGMGVMEIL